MEAEDEQTPYLPVSRGGLPQTPYAGSLQRNRNTLPKARQRQGPPSPEVVAAAAPPRGPPSTVAYGSRTYSNSNRYRESSGGRGGAYQGEGAGAGSNNTLPRVTRRDARPPRGGGGGGQSGSYGTLPRNYQQQRGGGGGAHSSRPQSWYGGSGGGSLTRGGRGGAAGGGLPPRAPSQRVIYRSRRQMRSSAAEAGRSAGAPRAQSLPRQVLAAPAVRGGGGSGDLLATIWSPDGKCPSFADILKRSSLANSADLADGGNSRAFTICHEFHSLFLFTI